MKSECINILYHTKPHGSLTSTSCSKQFSHIMRFVRYYAKISSILLCNSNGKQTQLLWVFVFVIEHSGKFINTGI